MKVELDDFMDYVLPKLSALTRNEMVFIFEDYKKRKLEEAIFAIEEKTRREVIQFINKHGIDKFLKVMELFQLFQSQKFKK